MTKIRYFFLITNFFFQASFLSAEETAAFLSIAPTARQASLGSLDALGRGGESVFYNPAGLAQAPGSMTASYGSWLGGSTLNSFSVNANFKDIFSWGVGVIALTQEKMTSNDEQGNSIGEFGASDLSLSLSLARQYNGWRMGASLKAVRQGLAESVATAPAWDIGLQKRAGRVGFGVLLKNIGGKLSLGSETQSLPSTAGGGFQWETRTGLYLQAGVEYGFFSKSLNSSIGFEFELGNQLSLRSSFAKSLEGLAPGSTGIEEGFLSKMKFGMGWKIFKNSLGIDYAFNPGEAGLAMTHQFSLQFHFSKARHPGSDADQWRDFF